MATTTVSVTINTPANVTVAQVVDTLCAYWGYQDTIDGQPNPQTKAQFVKARVAGFVKESYVAARATADAEAARLAAVAAAGGVTVD